MKNNHCNTGAKTPVDFTNLTSSIPNEQSLLGSYQTPTSEFAYNQLLPDLWRTPDGIYFIGILDKETGQFRNISVRSADEGLRVASQYPAMGQDVFFAIAVFTSPESRSTPYTLGAWAFHLDIDVEPEKAAAGKVYATLDEVKTALPEFCKRAGIPEPTHLVESGSGLHAYWVLTSFLDRQAWQRLAKKFKALTQALGLRADPSRTADIASVLRVPGTLNFKSSPPKPVTHIHSTRDFIDTEVMRAAIEAAFDEHCGGGAIDVDQAIESAPPSPTPVPVSDAYIEPPNFAQLTSALKALDPDCDEKTWKFYRLAPMAYTAREFPEINDRLYQLARDWSSGDLRGIPSKKWCKPGGNGLSGRVYFNHVWKRFLTDTYAGKRVTLGSLYFHAQEVGWVYVPDMSALGGYGKDFVA